MSRIVPFEELQQLSGYQKPTALRKWLEARKIEYVTDRENKPFTTIDRLIPSFGHSNQGESDAPNWSDPPITERRSRKGRAVLPSPSA